MAIIVDWANSIINVPRADMTLIQSNPTEIRELDTNSFRLELRDLEDSEDGRPFPITHNHNEDVLVGGISLADVLIIREPYTITFEDGQYAVYLQGSNNNILEKTNKNQVSVNPSNSAGLITSAGIEALEYDGQIAIDVLNDTGKAVSGSLYPVGTLRKPCLTLNDVMAVNNFRVYNKMMVISDITITGAYNLDYWTIRGLSHVNTFITLDTSASFIDARIENARINGVLDGGNEIDGCVIDSLSYVYGHIHNSALAGKITLGGSDDAFFDNCKQLDHNINPEIDMGGSGQNLVVTGFDGILVISNLNGASNKVGVGLRAGQVMLKSNVTAGEIHVSGDGRLVDESFNTIPSGTWNGGVTILNETSSELVWDVSAANHITAGSVGQQALDTLKKSKLAAYKL